MEQLNSAHLDTVKNEGIDLSELREAITSGEFYLVTLPAWLDSAVVLILKDEKIISDLAAAILNVRHEGFLHLLEEGKMRFERKDSEVFVDSNDFMKFREEWESDNDEWLKRLCAIDSEDDYI